MTKPRYYFVFDVESVGLYGTGFAYGAVLIDPEGTEIASWCEGTKPDGTMGDALSWKWVQDNIPLGSIPQSVGIESLRRLFWDTWKTAQGMAADRGANALMVADCPYPVETNFLASVVNQCATDRFGESPYPLIDVGSVRLAAGMNPLGSCERLPNELPIHNPLADARQSARLLREALAWSQSR